MLELPQPAITKSRTAAAGTNSKQTRRGKPSRISSVISRAVFRSSQSEMLFLGRLCFRWREHVCVEQVLAAPGLLLRRACRRETAHVSSLHTARFLRKREMPFLCCPELRTPVPSRDWSAAVHFCSFTRYRVVTGSYGHGLWPIVKTS